MALVVLRVTIGIPAGLGQPAVSQQVSEEPTFLDPTGQGSFSSSLVYFLSKSELHWLVHLLNSLCALK